MANWKLTPKQIGGGVFAITPEWTSGGGCYRVKRFSSQFPFFGYGNDEIVKAISQLLRWSSKVSPSKDVSVLFKMDGNLIHLFNSQPFVVEFFRQLWSSHPISESFCYVATEKLSRYHYRSALSSLDQVGVVNLFKVALAELDEQMRDSSCNSAMSVFNCCKESRKEQSSLDSVVEPSSLIGLTLWDMGEFLKTEPPIIKVKVPCAESHNADAISLRKKEARKESFMKIKSLNKERSSSSLTDKDIEFLVEVKHVVAAQKNVSFSIGAQIENVLDHNYELTIYSYGAYCLLVVSSINQGFVSYLPVRDQASAKKMALIFQSSPSIDKHLCFKISVGVDRCEVASVAVVSDEVMDFFNEHWAGTSVSFCSYTSMSSPANPAPTLQMIERVCQSAHQVDMRSSSMVACR